MRPPPATRLGVPPPPWPARPRLRRCARRSSALSDPAYEAQERPEGDQRECTFGERTEVPEGVAAPVARAAQVPHVGNNGVELIVGEGGRAEGGHLSGSGAHRLGDLDLRRR